MKKKQKKQQVKSLHQGFSLMETLIVVAVIGIFGGLVAVGGVEFRNRAKVRAANQEMETFKLLLLDYYDSENGLPASDIGLKALVDNGYLVIRQNKIKDNKILDPWNNGYEYSLSDDGNGFTITCYGSDKKADGKSHAADITVSEGLSGGSSE